MLPACSMWSACRVRRRKQTAGRSRQDYFLRSAVGLLLQFPLSIVNLDSLRERLDLLSHLGGVADNHDRCLIGRDVLTGDVLDFFFGDCFNPVAIRLEIVVRQIEHPDAYQLIYQPILSLNPNREHPREIGLGIPYFIVGNRLSANALELVEEFVQRGASYRSANLRRGAKGSGQTPRVQT